jgi:hypothetical protein
MVEVIDDTVIERCFGDDSGNIYEAEGPGASLAYGVVSQIESSFKKENNAAEAARVLADYTAGCLGQVLEKMDALRSQFAVQVAEVPEAFRPFVGNYVGPIGPLKNAVFKVLVQNQRLAVDIPGQAVVELKDPDAEGLRRLALTDAVAFAFDTDSSGVATGLRLFQTTEMARKAAEPDSQATGVPAQYAPYVGSYLVPPGAVSITVVVAHGVLALEIPNQGTVALDPPDTQGRWHVADHPEASVCFEMDAAGKAIKMSLRQAFTLSRQAGETAGDPPAGDKPAEGGSRQTDDGAPSR